MRAGESETRTIHGVEVTTVRMGAMRGGALKHEVTQMIVREAERQGRSIAEVGKLEMGAMVEAAFRNLAPADRERFTMQALAQTSVVVPDARGDKIRLELTSSRNIDAAFDADHYAVDKAVFFAVEVNLRQVFVDGAGTARPTPTP